MKKHTLLLLALANLFVSTSAHAASYFCKWSAQKIDGQNFTPWENGELMTVDVEPSTIRLNGLLYSNPTVSKLPDGTLKATYFTEKSGTKFVAAFAIDKNGAKNLAIYNDKSKQTLAGPCVQK